LAGTAGSDARPDFSQGRDNSQVGSREDGAYGGSTWGSDNPSTDSHNTAIGAKLDPNNGAQDKSVSGPPRPEHETDKTGVTGIHSNDAKFSDQRPTDANTSGVSDRGQNRAPAGGVGAVEPSVGADPASGQKPIQKQQGADRPTDEPTGEQVDAVKNRKDAVEEGATKKDPNDHSGEPLGSVKKDEKKGGEEDGPGGSSKGEGTGEKYVKTSGMAIDGGDFDATKPGAGREADRLLEEKGIHTTSGAAPKGDTPSESSSSKPDKADKADKPSMGEKIKGKLHIGKKDK